MNSKKVYRAVRIICSLLLIISLIVADKYYSSASISRSPRLNVRNLSLTKNKSYTIRLYNIKAEQTISFKSSNKSVVQIKHTASKFCVIRGKSTGSATVTATINDQEADSVSKLKCKVNVSPPALSVKFNNKKYKMVEGTTKKIKVSVKPNTSSERPVFKSDNESVATISSSGIVNALSPGKTVIHAVIANGKEATVKIVVVQSDSKPTEVPPVKTIPPVKTPVPAPSPTPSAAPSASPIVEHSDTNTPVNSSKKKSSSKKSSIG